MMRDPKYQRVKAFGIDTCPHSHHTPHSEPFAFEAKLNLTGPPLCVWASKFKTVSMHPPTGNNAGSTSARRDQPIPSKQPAIAVGTGKGGILIPFGSKRNDGSEPG